MHIVTRECTSDAHIDDDVHTRSGAHCHCISMDPSGFNGDFVDRGQYSCECALTLLAFKILYPKSVQVNRGNHECRDINSRDGFEKECLQSAHTLRRASSRRGGDDGPSLMTLSRVSCGVRVCRKYNHAVFDLFSDVFACLPLAAVINHEIFVVHGGLSHQDFTLAELNSVDRYHEIPPSESLMEDVMWSDPDKRNGRHASPRGAGLSFGQDVTANFLSTNQLRLIIRSHECMQKGFEMHHDDRVITVFSASNYCGTVNNEGSFIILERDLIPRIVPFFAKPKERLSRYRMRHAVMENDIIAKLLQRIADNRLALTNWYRGVETVTAAGVRTVSRAQWAEGLKAILNLRIPFSEFQDYLGLPKLGVDGKKKGDIDYMVSGAGSAFHTARFDEHFTRPPCTTTVP
jgi:diadenosine tetraphosphatase ApaH/serine/threonine PP2A family protein phosphatase